MRFKNVWYVNYGYLVNVLFYPDEPCRFSDLLKYPSTIKTVPSVWKAEYCEEDGGVSQ